MLFTFVSKILLQQTHKIESTLVNKTRKGETLDIAFAEKCFSCRKALLGHDCKRSDSYSRSIMRSVQNRRCDVMRRQASFLWKTYSGG